MCSLRHLSRITNSRWCKKEIGRRKPYLHSFLLCSIDYHTKMRQQNFFCTFRAYALLMRLALKTGKHDFVVQLFHEAKEARESLKLRARRGDQAADERKGALWADRIYPLAALALAEQDKCEEMVALLKENITQK